MSLSKRLQRVQETTEPSKEDFSQWSMADLEVSTIDFGKQQKGKTYATVWEEDQPWITWFVQHYEKSAKSSHQKFIHYVNLKVERAELTGTKIPVTEKSEGYPTISPEQQVINRSRMMARAKAKAMSRHVTPIESDLWNEEEDPLMYELISNPVETAGPVAEEPIPCPSQLEMRVINMENALARVMDFLEQNHANRENLN